MTNRVYRSFQWPALSKRCLVRDGGRCQIRLPGCTGVATCADHIVELADGGALFDLSNLQAACRSCNTAKRNRAQAARAARQVRDW